MRVEVREIVVRNVDEDVELVVVPHRAPGSREVGAVRGCAIAHVDGDRVGDRIGPDGLTGITIDGDSGGRLRNDRIRSRRTGQDGDLARVVVGVVSAVVYRKGDSARGRTRPCGVLEGDQTQRSFVVCQQGGTG